MISDQDKWVEEKARELVKLSIYQEIGIGGCTIIGNSIDTSEAKNIILSIVKEIKPVVDKEWVYYFCAYINAGHKSPADDEARVGLAIKKLRDIGVEVISDKGSK